MNVTAIQNLITTTLGDFGFYVLQILTAVIAIGVAYLVFRFGWKQVQSALHGGDTLFSYRDFNGNYHRSRKARNRANDEIWG